ncbi:MAG: response regulator transcription factor [Bacteroidales bacterium]|nr:response regulator transcription factor [Bacteroidales bacterium]
MGDKVKILIAEQSKIFRETLKLFLVGKSKYKVVGESANCKAISMLLEKELPDIAILNLEMLYGTCSDFILKLKRKYHNKIKFIVLTRFDEIEYEKMMINAGADGYIKEIDVYYQLENAIKQVLNGELFYSDNTIGFKK